jgi:hypothetical protein
LAPSFRLEQFVSIKICTLITAGSWFYTAFESSLRTFDPNEKFLPTSLIAYQR